MKSHGYSGTQGNYGYTPVGKSALQKTVNESHKQSMCVLAVGLILIFMMLILGFCFTWYSTSIPRSCPTNLGIYFWLTGISNLTLAVLLAIGLYLMKGMMLSMSHQTLAQGMEDHAQEGIFAWGVRVCSGQTAKLAMKFEFQLFL